jgi:hypothetical protein
MDSKSPTGNMELTQRLMLLPIAARTALVDAQTARAALGVDADSISAMVDAGELRWVFDVSLNGAGDRTVRELRFWAKELAGNTGRSMQDTKPGAIVDEIIGFHAEEKLRAVTVAQLLLISRPQVHRILDAGLLQGFRNGHAEYVWRASLVSFLCHRLVGESSLATLPVMS